MMIAATLAMLISMTFRIPEGAYGAIYALTLSRESPRATVGALKTVALAFAIAAGYELVGALIFLNDPIVRLIWVCGTFFLMFYCLSALTNYTAGVRFGYLVVITTPIWDRHISAEAKVEGTLWAVWAITLASIITTLVELAYAEIARGTDLVRPVVERLTYVEEVLLAKADGRPVPEMAEKNITRMTMVGMSRFRRNLERSGYSENYREQMGAVLALVGRLVDTSANLLDVTASERDRERMLCLAQKIAGSRAHLERGAPLPQQADNERADQSSVPLLREMETTVSLLADVFAGSQPLSAYAPHSSADTPRARLFRPDALSNLDHVKFGLKGGLAASLCYIIYNLVAWPGINTAVTTCLLTALTTIGSSRQKQVLRIAGAIVGGVLLGMGAQIFILPHLDSIGGFTILFLAVTFIASWFATCSARLSYFGVQIAVAFYLINLKEFTIQISLGVARDRVAGILLGLFVMWLVFDHLWGAPSVVEMKSTFIANLRLLAQLAREPVSQEMRTAVERWFSLRETINTNFDKVRALRDGVVLEFGQSREQDLAFSNRIRQWQTQLRMLFITDITLWRYRMRFPGFDLPEPIWQAQLEFDHELAKTLDAMADRFEGKSAETRGSGLEACRKHLEQVVQIPGELEAFLALSRRVEQLATSLNREI
jgi:multidrug resistance protein MdtO